MYLSCALYVQAGSVIELKPTPGGVTQGVKHGIHLCVG